MYTSPRGNHDYVSKARVFMGLAIGIYTYVHTYVYAQTY